VLWVVVGCVVVVVGWVGCVVVVVGCVVVVVGWVGCVVVVVVGCVLWVLCCGWLGWWLVGWWVVVVV